MWQEILTTIIVTAASANLIYHFIKMLLPKEQEAGCGCSGASSCSLKMEKHDILRQVKLNQRKVGGLRATV